MEIETRSWRTCLPAMALIALLSSALLSIPASAQPKPSGQRCSTNNECATQRCDLAASGSARKCIPNDGDGASGEYCSHPNQCRRPMNCRLIPGEPQVCSYPLASGQKCLTGADCKTRRCDTAPGNPRVCIPNDGQGALNEYCSHENQCRGNYFCQQIPGPNRVPQCKSAQNLGAPCLSNKYCRSARCDMPQQSTQNALAAISTISGIWGSPLAGVAVAGVGDALVSGGTNTYRCIPNDGTGLAGHFCSHNNHCRPGHHCRILPNQQPACSAPVAVGVACLNNTDCGSGRCDLARGNPRLCIPNDGQGIPGQYCSHDNQCNSKRCRKIERGGTKVCLGRPRR